MISVNLAILIYHWIISLVVRHVSVTGIHRYAQVQRDITL